jgi:hypothetical protein
MPHLTESRGDSWLDKKGGAAAALFDATRNLGLGEPLRRPSKTSNGESRRLAIVFASDNFDWTPGAQYIRVLCECVRVPTTPNLQGGPKGGWR